MSTTSVLNTDAGLSAKTLDLLESDQTVTGLKTFDRDPSAPFAVSSGSATVANLDVDKLDGKDKTDFLLLDGTQSMVGDLKFTDALYDVGKVGATRPRDGFFSRDVTVGRNLYVNDTSNASNSGGATINQGAADNEILSLKSSDVAHGITNLTETDTFGYITKAHPNGGGTALYGISDADGNDDSALYFVAVVGQAVDTGKTNSAKGAINLEAYTKNSADTSSIGANANIASFSNGNTTRFILDADGDSHQDVGTAWTNFDSHDDIAVLDAIAVEVAQPDDPWKDAIRQNLLDSLGEMIPRRTLENMKLVTFNEGGHHFVNMSKLTMLLTGAVRQLAREKKNLSGRIEQLERKLLMTS